MYVHERNSRKQVIQNKKQDSDSVQKIQELDDMEG